MAANAFPDATPIPMRGFGRFELRRLLGKSAATMLWLVFDRQLGAELMLTMPRQPLLDAAALARWTERARHAARLEHTNLAPVAAIGVHEYWPYVAVDRAAWITLPEWIADHPKPASSEIARWLCDALTGLAAAHDAGVAHGDPQLHHLLVDERGAACLMALGAAAAPAAPGADAAGGRSMAMDPAQLRNQRAAAERDVLACGVLLQHLLGGEAPLGSADTARVIEQIAPLGREVLRLPRSTPVPVPEALRAIANRASSTQERLRYRSARTLRGALGGWLDAQARESRGPVAVLLGRLHGIGHLPAMPGLSARIAKITALDAERTDEIASRILPDFALAFELLRTLNSAPVQGTQIAGDGPVLTLRRVVELIGIDGVRDAADTLKAWPGPLGADAAARLRSVIERVRLAAHLAQRLRPAGYDPEVVFLVAVLQNLARLLLRYHFADEAEQIEQLMRPASVVQPNETTAVEVPGLSEDAAAVTVLGVDIGTMGAAVARHWGFGEEVMQMIRRASPDDPVRKPDSDAEVLRIVASAANETVDAMTLLPPKRVAAALERVVERYARALKISVRTLRESIDEARAAMRPGAAPDLEPRPAPEPTAPAEFVD